MRVFAVVLTVLYALAYGIPTVLALDGRYGSIGVVKAGATGTMAPDVNTLAAVVPGSPAARAGIVPGDVVVPVEAEHALPVQQLFYRAAAGQPTPYAVTHDGRRRVVSLTPVASRGSARENALVVAQLVRGFVIVLIGALLVLLRPSIMTAAFFVLCLQFGELAHPTGNLELVAAVPFFWKPLFLALTCIVSGGSAAVAAIFCLRFPTGTPLPSWRPVEKVMIAVGVLTILDYFFALVAGATYTPLGNALYLAFSVASWLSYLVATVSFMARYRAASGEDRDRLRWVAIGLGSFLVSYALYWIAQNVASVPGELSTWAQFLNLLPLTVLYAVVRHRVIDVRLAGGRAIAYAVLSAVPVAAFSLIDWALSNQLAQTRFAVFVEVCVSIAFGFWVNSSQRRIDNLIETLFFHARRVAEERLRGVARRIAHVTERAPLDETLVREPFEALGLTSSALFRLIDGTWARVADRGWPDDVLAVIDPNDDLVLEIVATRAPVDVQKIGWGHGRLAGPLRPAVAYPILVRQEPVGLLLLGTKRDGERFDALEHSSLQVLVDSAAATYDHLEAMEQRSLAAELQRALEEARRENETLRALPARAASRA
jgi:membrane-associated protease RseP (regulator of RpoE activity)